LRGGVDQLGEGRDRRLVQRVLGIGLCNQVAAEAAQRVVVPGALSFFSAAFASAPTVPACRCSAMAAAGSSPLGTDLTSVPSGPAPATMAEGRPMLNVPIGLTPNALWFAQRCPCGSSRLAAYSKLRPDADGHIPGPSRPHQPALASSRVSRPSVKPSELIR